MQLFRRAVATVSIQVGKQICNYIIAMEHVNKFVSNSVFVYIYISFYEFRSMRMFVRLYTKHELSIKTCILMSKDCEHIVS